MSSMNTANPTLSLAPANLSLHTPMMQQYLGVTFLG
jgi:hypothetical protein